MRGTELFEFADRRVAAANLLTGEGAMAPTDIALSNAEVIELSDDGTVVGTLSATDPDGAPRQAFTYRSSTTPTAASPSWATSSSSPTGPPSTTSSQPRTR